ncbi:ferredoxin [Lacisediminihabitans sp.]|uniref:ferredoxin n=1 Tax=Lacisediminihabitans sp. TaxID=2787631 RepID=UPI00374DD2B9
MSREHRPAATLHIDWTLCDGRGLCTELLPERLARDEWGYPLARDGSGGDVPLATSQLEAARDAVALCPRLALTLRKD